MNQQKVLLFDGVCNLCNGWVDFLLKYDSKKELKFAALQSDEAKQFVSPEFAKKLPSLVFVNGNYTYIESDAAIWVLASLGGWWRIALAVLVLPKFLRNWVYRLIAKNRYHWFGKSEQCRIPNAEERSRFL